ncbi:L-arabinose isomerase [Silvimonas sp. JCM 19000]
MDFFKELEVWFVVGSQHLYGKKTLAQVAQNAERIVNGLNSEGNLPIKLVLKETVTSQDGILQVCRDANHDQNCVGVVTWLHTFSPAKMWINGLQVLEKPMMQLHTQFNSVVPWNTMDMDFMNLNQTAHGGREFGFIGARMRKAYHVVVGHWQDPQVAAEMGEWIRVAAAVYDSKQLRIARFGDNMREVAVTEGDKVAAQIQFGYAVHAYGLGDLAKVVEEVTTEQIDALVGEYETRYQLTEHIGSQGEKRQHLIDAARIEIGIKTFLDKGNFKAFTTTFENLYGLTQLPGLAVQRLMEQGYGFGAEGDWKSAALLRAVKVMGAGKQGGSSFMEDYTYDFTPGNELVIGAHMLEVCPSIAGEQKAVLDVQPLSIGKKADPARLIFAAKAGPARNATLIDMGNRFRLIVNELDVIDQPKPLPVLPVARAVWKALPDLRTAAAAWIYAGGAHHSIFAQDVSAEQLRLFAELTRIEYLHIGADTTINDFKNQINWNEVYFKICDQ